MTQRRHKGKNYGFTNYIFTIRIINMQTRTYNTMKLKLILTTVFCTIVGLSKAQSCDIQIQILEDKYMFGQVQKMEDTSPIKKMKVSFNSEFMEVILPIENQNYLIRVVNENCQAYCSRAKRIRQLHSGDEKLVRNLFKEKQEAIVQQINGCDS